MQRRPSNGEHIRRNEETPSGGSLARNFKEVEDAIQADETGDGFIKDMFLYELRNHEYTYTCEVEETVEACGFTMEQIENDERLRHGLEEAAKELREAAGFSF